MPTDTITLEVCRHCSHNKPTISLRGSLVYCQDCWDEINKRKSETMREQHIKRSAETRAAMSASKRANKKDDPIRWKLFYDFYLDHLLLEEKYQRMGA